MKLSLKVEYACRVLGQMGKHYGCKNLIHIEELAQKEAVPKNYLVQILSELRGGGLIVSRRGKQGGYALIRPPEEITLYEIIQVVDSELLERRFTTQGQSGLKVAEVWKTISLAFESMTREYTLKSFSADDTDQMYHI